MKNLRTIAGAFAAFLSILVMSAPASAHSQGESYVFFSITDDSLTGRFEAILSDIDRMLPIDANGDGEISESEFTAKTPEIFDFFDARFGITNDGQALTITPDGSGILDTPQGQFGQISFIVNGLTSVPDTLEVTYQPLIDADTPNHGGYGVIENNTRTGVVDNEAHIALFFKADGGAETLSTISDPWHKIFVEFVWQGVLHIWFGFDHVLFLITLLLPAVLMRQSNAWEPVSEFRDGLWNVVKIATVFTVSHSVTLSLAALGIVTLPVTLVEAIIAVSIAVVAFGNMFPIWHHRVLLIVFIFGLFHGFGFANVLEPLGLVPSAKVVGLLAFNIGVELGQIAIILVLFPILYLIRTWTAYPFLALKLGSVAIIIMAGIWIVERTAPTFWKYQQQLFAMVG